jgi:mono/diheme cytochrome c family protein
MPGHTAPRDYRVAEISADRLINPASPAPQTRTFVKHNIRNYAFIAFLVSLPIVYSRSFASSFPEAAIQASSDHGAAMFRKACSICHSTRSGETKAGPSLYGVLREGSGHSEQVVRQTIADGKGTMPASKEKLEPGEIDDLIEYLRTL